MDGIDSGDRRKDKGRQSGNLIWFQSDDVQWAPFGNTNRLYLYERFLLPLVLFFSLTLLLFTPTNFKLHTLTYSHYNSTTIYLFYPSSIIIKR